MSDRTWNDKLHQMQRNREAVQAHQADSWPLEPGALRWDVRGAWLDVPSV